MDDLAEALAYAEAVAEGKIEAGRWVKAATTRFLADLELAERGQGRWRFDRRRAVHPIRFTGLMTNIKGPEAGRPIALLPFQKWILANLFGWVERETGLRRFRQASIWLPKGNGKTTQAAVLALYVTFSEGEGGAEGYTAAVTRAQASIAFDMARAMAQANPGFVRHHGIRIGADALSQIASQSRLVPVSSDAAALDGINLHFGVLDEIASHKSSAVYDALITAMPKRAQPLLISISTATDNVTGIGRQVWNYTEQVLSGALRDDRFFGVIYAADPDDDPWSEATWQKANPGWGRMVQPEAIRSIARQALASPALQAAFKTRHLNLWVSAQNALFDSLRWAACADPELSLEELRGEPCYAALDMAARTDIAAGALLFPLTGEDGKTRYRLFAKTWLPAAAVDVERNPLYVQWAEAGALEVTPGETVDFSAIEDWLRQIAGEYDLRACGYDPYMMLQFSQRLENDGLPMREYRSSTLNFSEPTKLLDSLMRDRLLTHDGNPVLTWAIGNVVGHYDARSNVYPRRESAEKKIDAAIAAIIALGVSLADERDGGYLYRAHGLLVF